MKYRIGQWVKIKSKLKCKGYYKSEILPEFKQVFVKTMKPFCGRIAKINSINKRDYGLDIDIDDYSWTYGMLTKPTRKEINAEKLKRCAEAL